MDHPDLRIAVSHEFLEREDGWPGLSRAYGFDRPIDGIDHGLAYQALAEGTIDVTDAYSTDGELVRYDLAVLADDRRSSRAIWPRRWCARTFQSVRRRAYACWPTRWTTPACRP